MNVEEIQQARAVATAKITEILREFESVTGLKVTVVGVRSDIDAPRRENGTWPLKTVEIEAKLP